MQLLRKKVMNEIRELTEMEVEAVSGGGPLFNLGDIIVQNNIAVPTAVAVSVGGDATGANVLGSLKNLAFHA
jgi:hypothetical protein